MHLDDEQLQRLVHDEMDRGARNAAARHLAECDACVARVDDLRREEEEIADLLGHLDHAMPTVSVDSLLRTRRTSRVWLRRAAGFVAVAAFAGIAYAIPGSPLRDWVRSTASWVTARVQAPAEQAPSPAGTSGIALEAGDRFSIDFSSPRAGGTILVSLVDGSSVAVRVVGGTAHFTTGTDQLSIVSEDAAASYEIDLPRDAAWIEIRAGSEQLMLKDGDTITTRALPDAEGRYTLPLMSPGPPGQ